MKEIFVNLKRFDVPRERGGVCPCGNPAQWIEQVMAQSVALGLGALEGRRVTYLLPEALIVTAQQTLARYPAGDTKGLSVGSQTVYRADVEPGGNFGAFTGSLPAASAWGLGCRTAMIGHSEERRDKQQIIAAYAPSCLGDDGAPADSEEGRRCQAAVDRLIRGEVRCALRRGMNVLLCVGETARERGGDDEGQQDRVRATLRAQLERCLEGAGEVLGEREIVIGYEPIWAIGPGKTPPGAEYIGFVSSFIKQTGRALGLELKVVYGGGLKEENAAMIASVPAIDGGLVALTRFTGKIGFSVEELKRILEQYV